MWLDKVKGKFNDESNIKSIKVEKLQLIIFALVFVIIFTLGKPALYTYFIYKANSTDDVINKVNYAKKAIRFGNIESGRKLYDLAMINYIKSISESNPEKALELSKKESKLAPDNFYDEAFAYAYSGAALKLVNIDKSNALYNFILGFSYSTKIGNNLDFNNLLKSTMTSKLSAGAIIVDYISGDIDDDGIAELGLVTSNSSESRFIIFKYIGNDFKEAYNTKISSTLVSYLKFDVVGKDKKVFLLINKANEDSNELTIISFLDVNNKIEKIYSNITKNELTVEDIDKDRYLELGTWIRTDETGNNKTQILWQKWDENIFKYFKTTHPYNKQLDEINNIDIM